MTRIGILPGGSLLGREVAGRIAQTFPDADVQLLTRDPDQVGTLVDAGVAAALLEGVDDESLRRLDVLVSADTTDEELESLLAVLEARATLVLINASLPLRQPAPLVAGVNDSQAAGTRVVHSPHAVTIAVVLVLKPLLDLEPRFVSVTAIEPVSEHDRAGIDELAEQTRALLTFQPHVPQERLGAQLAFNLVPRTDAHAVAVSSQLRAVLGRSLPVEVTLLRAGVFHGLAMTVTCFFERPVSPTTVRDRLETAPHLEVAAAGAPAPGSRDAAIHEEVLVVMLDPAGETDTMHFFVTVDHLVRGGAANAVDLLATVLAEPAGPTH